ncbi:MAG: PAS domain-containing protein [Hyphomicrobiales bacterium]
MQRAFIREWFTRERTLQLPLPGLRGIRIPEQMLRKLILVLTALFLFALAAALLSKLFEYRRNQIADQSSLTLLHADATAHAIRNARIATPDVKLGPQLLQQALPATATERGRQYLLVDTAGKITAAIPQQHFSGGQALADTMAKDFFVDVPFDGKRLTPTRLRSGESVHAVARTLAPLDGSLIVLQSSSAMLDSWSSSAGQLGLLFGVTLVVLTLLTAAFHWQSSRASEADEMLSLATLRLDKALDGGQCGLWDWDLSTGRMFWSASMFSILGLTRDADTLSYADIASLMHPGDQALDELADDLLKHRRADFDTEFRMRHVKGHYVWLRARAALAHWASVGRAGHSPPCRHCLRHHAAEGIGQAEP